MIFHNWSNFWTNSDRDPANVQSNVLKVRLQSTQLKAAQQFLSSFHEFSFFLSSLCWQKFYILLSFAFLGASLAIPNLRHFQLSFSTHFGWFHKVLSEDSDWFHHQWFFGHNDMVIFLFLLSFLCVSWLLLAILNLRHFSISFFFSFWVSSWGT